MPGEAFHLQAYLTYGVSLLITPSLNAFAMRVLHKNTYLIQVLDLSDRISSVDSTI